MSYFSPSGSAGAPAGEITIAAPTTPAIGQVSLATAGTEYSFTLPAGCKQFMLRLQSLDATLQIAYVAGQSGITYLTVPTSCTYSEDNLQLTSNTDIYFQSNKNLQVLEIVYWL